MEESLRQEILRAFPGKVADIRSYSPLTLAFLGDAVYSIIIRTIIVSRGNRRPEKLHNESEKYVCAAGQAAVAGVIRPMLCEEEETIFRRGLNSNPNHHAKNATIKEYLQATALETLCGYLYLKDETTRLLDLISAGLEKTALGLSGARQAGYKGN